MKNKGFTLAELLGVISIVGMLMVLVFPMISNNMKDKEEEIDEMSKELIYTAVDIYVKDNINEYEKKDNAIYCIALQKLVDDGALSENTVNKFDLNLYVKAEYNGEWNYSLVKTCTEVY